MMYQIFYLGLWCDGWQDKGLRDVQHLYQFGDLQS